MLMMQKLMYNWKALTALLLIVLQVCCYDEAAPVWLTSEFFRAGNEYVINTRTGNDQTPEFTFHFSSALPGTPNLAYGMKNYRGDDYFGVEQFEIRRVSLTSSTFKVAVQIFGSTYIWMMGVPYIAIDPTFPHRLNSFDGVPLNYGAGDLINVTAKNPSQVLYYSNTINYTQQAAGTSFTEFREPFQSNKILLFMMALNIWSTNEGSGSTWYPLTLKVDAEVMSTQTYKLSFELSYNVMISLLHFSMIIYDVADVESSKKYFIVTEKVDFPIEGGFYEIPPEFVDNFIMGLLDFSTARGQAVLQYNWEYETVDGQFGARVNYSIPTRAEALGVYALTRQGTMVFYMKTWQCPTGFDFFNLTTNLCQDMCGSYHFENNSIYECQYCSYSCHDCTSGLDCLECNANDHRYLTNDKSCECEPGYYENHVDTSCTLCSTAISNCIDCFYNSTYRAGDSGAVQYGCFECADGYLLINNQCQLPVVCPAGSIANTETNACESCPTGCTACSSLTNCTSCNTGLNYFLQNSICVLCSLDGCTTCQSLDACQTCQSGFTLVNGICTCGSNQFYDSFEEACEECSVVCKVCSGPSSYECLACNASENRVLIGGNCACDPYNYEEPSDSSTQCVKINNNTCDRGYIYITQLQRCKEICGDGVQIEVECDDGNIENGDGCTDQCKIQGHFVCDVIEANDPSVCRLDTAITVNDAVIKKVQGVNEIVLTLDISPKTSVIGDFDLGEILHFQGGIMSIQDAYYDETTGQIVIRAGYEEHMEGREVVIEVKQNHFFNPNYPDNASETIYTTSKATWSFSSEPIKIVSDNNLEANVHSEETYEEAQSTGKAALAFGIVVCVLAFAAMFLKSSISVMMNITAIQLAYLGIVSITAQHPITNSLALSMKPAVGYNYNEFDSQAENESVNGRAESMGFVQEFLNNFNVMLLIQMTLIAFMGFLYLASHRKPGIKTGFKILQREVLLIIMFNIPNVMFSIALVQEPTMGNIVFGSGSIAIIVAQAIYVVKKGEDYLGFKELFDLSDKGHYKKVMIVFFISRVGACFSLAFVITDPIKGLIGSAVFEAIFVIFVFYGKPFVSFFHNLFVMVCELASIGFFASTYASQSLQTEQGEYCVRAMVYILGAMTLIATFSLGYSIYYDCVNKGKKAKIFNEVQQTKKKIQEQEERFS